MEERVWVKLLNFEFAPLKVEQHQNYNIINCIININIYPELYYLIFQSSIFKAFWKLNTPVSCNSGLLLTKIKWCKQHCHRHAQSDDKIWGCLVLLYFPKDDSNMARDFTLFEQIFWQSSLQDTLLQQQNPSYKHFFLQLLYLSAFPPGALCAGLWKKLLQ